MLSLRPQRPLKMQRPARPQHLQHPARLSQAPRSWRICLAHSKSRSPQPRSHQPQGAQQRLWGTMRQPLQMWWRHPLTTPLRQHRTRLLTRAARQPSLCRQLPLQMPLQRPPRLGHQRLLQQQTCLAGRPSRSLSRQSSLKPLQHGPHMLWALRPSSPRPASQAPNWSHPRPQIPK